jgi:dipeptidyl aminopeptidase/acylaminoacyl peptidase
MKTSIRPRPPLWTLALSLLVTTPVLAFPAPLAAQEATVPGPLEAASDELRLLGPDDYGEFESLGAVSLSPTGDWLVAIVSRVDADGEVRIRHTDGNDLVVVNNGIRAEFSADGSWAAVAVQPAEAERERLARDEEPIRNDLVLVELATADTTRRARVAGWSFSPDGAFLALRRYGSDDDEHSGVDVVVRELATGIELNMGNVAEMVWHHERPLLAMVVDAEGMAGNGVRIYHASTGTMRTLHSKDARFSDLTWREEATDVAVLRSDPDTARGDTLMAVLAWSEVEEPDPGHWRLEGAWEGGVEGEADEERRITDFRGLRWAEDGSRLFFGTVPRDPVEKAPAEDEGDPAEDEGDPAEDDEAEDEEEKDAEEAPDLEIWHARDIDPVPQQRVQANQLRTRSDLTAWEPASGRTTVLGGMARDEVISLTGDEARALLQDGAPYAEERMFGPVYRDMYAVDLGTGQRELLLERVQFSYGSSPGGRYILFFEDDQWHVWDLAEATRRNLTSELPTVFVNQENDHTVEQPPPYGTGGWMDDDEAVLLYDRYDVWRVAPDGSGGERLTRGHEEDVRHRVVRLDLDAPAHASREPLYLSLYGHWTKESGYARLHPDGQVEPLIYEAASISRLATADEADRYIFVEQRYDLPPRVHITDGSFAERREGTAVNTDVLNRFHWGHAELVDYENEWGEPLQGALFYPADYEPGREYPMIVYHYERLSQILHNWTNPSERSAYNTTVFSHNGYFVFQPDIVYRDRNPGVAFMESVLPALDAALEAAPVDPERVGIIGHSWGGYQTTFAVTQTDRFAAGVAGAPLTNLISMYLSFYWNTGGTDARIFEISQARMEVPWWEDYESYRANSPVHHIEQMNTPLLMAFGTEDGAVEFNQGVEFYNAARRAGKDFVLLVYEGENHSLQREPNQLDYHRRTLEWFDHYLNGAEAPAWITDGVPYLEQQEKLERGPAAGR